jgi:hypothetical protein
LKTPRSIHDLSLMIIAYPYDPVGCILDTCSRSNDEHEPAEEQVEEDDGVEGQLPFMNWNHFANEGD